MKMNHIILCCIALLLSYIPNSISVNNDFCVADLSLPKTPSGYQCKSEKDVTVDDFVFSGFVAANATKPFNTGITFVNVDKLPGLNGLGIATLRGDISINGSVPLHSHPDATELVIIVEGEVKVGFITPRKVFLKDSKPGDVIAIPKGQLHFVVNSGAKKAVFFAAFSSSDPSTQVVDLLLFGNDLSTAVLSQTTLLDVAQIKKLKAAFGGKN
ncbi:unnamed protein product [Lathyrus oleraceus]|uniref:Germin-like protein n=1 Tax=Pisum sativum TaxID=3888 RepID=A0A9D4XJF4_PEA|nr:auxin-binding protein ABP19b-like [Pisum sativum]KAI5422216.1 hypothetical protein KIW84_045613 [Pisum sativum]